MTTNAAPGLNGDAGRNTDIVLGSFARIVDGAKPEKKFKVFELQARQLMGHVVSGVIDKMRTIDTLQEVAESNGLIEIHGEDAIQEIMSLAVDNPLQIARIAEDNASEGDYVRNQHEILLIAKRGNMPAPAPANRPPSVIQAPRPGRHSEKPSVFYEIIERMYPGLPRIELFARAVRPGWTAWGNEVPEN